MSNLNMVTIWPFIRMAFLITVGGKTLREHLEVLNHRDAIKYVEEIVQKDEPMSEWQIKNLHRLVLKGIDDEYAGVYRDQQVFISGAKHIPPAPFLIKDEMEQLMACMIKQKRKNCIRLLVELYYMLFLLEFTHLLMGMVRHHVCY
ncbi:Fic family protein [Neobacillus niacini]|nr:Fic family protein [Neobacillus niacini]